MLIDKFNEEETILKKENGKATKEETVVPEENTLIAILADEERSAHFGELLNHGPDEDIELAERLFTQKLNPGDMILLEKRRGEAVKRFESVENTEKFVTEENILSLGKLNPDFQNIINLVGPDKAIDVIKNELSGIAFTDNARYINIEKAINKLNKFNETKYKDLDDEVAQISKESGIKDSVYIKLLAIENKDEREKSIRKEIRNTYGIISLGMDWMTGQSKITAAELATKRNDILKVRNELERNIKNIGKLLSISVDENELMRKSLAKELTGSSENSNEEKAFGFKNSRDSVPTVENTKVEWEKYKKDIKWDNLTSSQDKDDKKRDFAESIAKKRSKGKGGFWEILFSSMFEDSKKELINNLN